MFVVVAVPRTIPFSLDSYTLLLPVTMMLRRETATTLIMAQLLLLLLGSTTTTTAFVVAPVEGPTATTARSRRSGGGGTTRHHHHHRHLASRTTTSPSRTTDTASVDEDDSTTTLTFSIDTIHESEPLRGDVTEMIRRFETSVDLRNCLITPDPSKVTEFRLNESDLQRLERYRQAFVSDDDDDDYDYDDTDEMIGIQFTTGAVEFPGLQIDSHVRCGVRRRRQSSSSTKTMTTCDAGEDDVETWLTTSPWEFHVLEATQTASGSRPMVWLWNKLTAAATPTSRSLTTVGLMRRRRRRRNDDEDDDDDDVVVLRYHSRATVRIPCSRRMRRFLPMSRCRTERMGSQALQRAVQREVQTCMTSCRSYLLSAERDI